jgi:hypothetical protein
MAGGYVSLLSQHRNLCLRDNGKEQNTGNENNRRGHKKDDNNCKGCDMNGM